MILLIRNLQLESAAIPDSWHFTKQRKSCLSAAGNMNVHVIKGMTFVLLGPS